MSDIVLRCLIVDDEPPAHKVIENYISRLDFLSLSGNAYNALDALSFLHQQTVDLMFLDINMPELTGLEMLKTLNNPPAVIMTTAYSEYALEGFDLGVKDYLLKPIRFNRFLKAVNRVLESKRQNATDDNQSTPKTKATNKGQTTTQDHFFIKIDGKTNKVNYTDILSIQSYGNYVKLNRKDKPMLMYTDTMKNLQNNLPDNFLRVHKSYIINVSHIDFIQGNFVQIQSERIPIGNSYKQQVLNRLG